MLISVTPYVYALNFLENTQIFRYKQDTGLKSILTCMLFDMMFLNFMRIAKSYKNNLVKICIFLIASLLQPKNGLKMTIKSASVENTMDSDTKTE